LDWVSVRVEPVRPLARPVTLAEIKAEPRLAKMELIRQSRLSVAPVRDEEWKLVLELARAR
jgi:predicted RNA-binding protein with PUA-like domain